MILLILHAQCGAEDRSFSPSPRLLPCFRIAKISRPEKSKQRTKRGRRRVPFRLMGTYLISHIVETLGVLRFLAQCLAYAKNPTDI